MRPLWTHAALATIVAASMAVAAAWALSVPLLQAPDENVHLDYVFALVAEGRLLTARNGHEEPDPSRPVTPLLALLEDRTDFVDVRQHPGTRIAPAYGTAEFRRSFDASASALPAPVELPFLVSYYPIGYYAMAALVMAAALHLTGPFEAALAVRLLSVAMLGVTLPLAYALYRRLRLRPPVALALTAVLGLLPLTSFVASYAQPDNLALLATTLVLYLSVVVVQRHGGRAPTLALGMALALVLLAKYQDFVIVALAVGAALAATRSLRPRLVALIATPSAAALGVQAWISFGPAPTYFSPVPDPNGRLPSTAALHAALHGGPLDTGGFLLQQTGFALADYFGVGQVSISFWGRFGWLDAPLVIGTPSITFAVRLLLWAGTAIVLALALLTALRVVAAGRRCDTRTAFRLLCGNPVVTSYVGFTVFMIGAFVYTGGSLYPQGRYWVPFLPGLLYMAAIYAPSAIRSRRLRSGVRVAVVAVLAAYVVAGVPSAMLSIHERYYGPASSANAPATARPDGAATVPPGRVGTAGTSGALPAG